MKKPKIKLFNNNLKLNNKKGFTLVELVVVITILAILGTIAFMAFKGYAASSRDAKRISDIKSIRTSLELFGLNTGRFPDPNTPYPVTFSGSEIRSQGTFGEQNFRNVDKLNKLPLDPLTELEYTYSVTHSKNEFELGAILETNNILSFNNINQVNALNKKKATAYIKGNYNGKILKINIGNITYVLAIPSIINGDYLLSDIIDLINAKHLAYNGYSNLPASYTGTTFEVNGEDDLDLINASELVVFSGSIEDLINPEDSTTRIELIQNIKEAYEGTDIENQEGIEEIVNIDFSSPDSDALEEYIAGTIINNEFGGELKLIPVSIPSIGGEGNNDETYVCENLTGDISENRDYLINYNLCESSEISYPASIDSEIVNMGDRDIFRLNLKEGVLYNLEIKSPVDDLDTVMFLFNSEGQLLIENDDNEETGNYQSTFSYTPENDGIYYIGIMGYDDENTGTYNLSIEEIKMPENLNIYELMFYFIENQNLEIAYNRFNNNLIEFNDKLYFSASPKDNNISSLYSIDSSGLINKFSLDVDENSNLNKKSLAVFNNKLYIIANDSIYYIDGTNTVTSIANTPNPEELIVYNNKLYFQANDPTDGIELFYIDTSDTVSHLNINPSGNSQPYAFTKFNDKLYFVASNGSIGYELFSIDNSNVISYNDINPGSSTSMWTDRNKDKMIVYNNKLYFYADALDRLYNIDSSGNISYIPLTGTIDEKTFTVFNNNLYFNYNGSLNYLNTSGTLNSLPITGANNPIVFNNLLYFDHTTPGDATIAYMETNHNVTSINSPNISVGDQLYFNGNYNNKIYYIKDYNRCGGGLFSIDSSNIVTENTSINLTSTCY